MDRINTINAREDMFGVGKSGFHDNADLPGQDATYVSPDWFNAVQEELCNLLELRGITLNPLSKRQLYDLLTTQDDLEALAGEIEANFIRKSQIVDNLTTNDSTKVASANQVKILQDNKLDKSALNNTLTSTSVTQALTAAQGKILNDKFTTAFDSLKVESGYQKLPSGLIFQWGAATLAASTGGTVTRDVTYPISFPNAVLHVFPTYATSTGANSDSVYTTDRTQTGFKIGQTAAETSHISSWLALGY